MRTVDHVVHPCLVQLKTSWLPGQVPGARVHGLVVHPLEMTMDLVTKAQAQ